MNQRAQYLVQVLEKIGSPLMEGLIAAAPQEENTADEAQKIAALLAASVKSGIDIGNMVDISKAGPEGDKLRIALTAIASSLIAQYFKQHGRIPDDTQNQKINAALQAVITFSDNFTDDSASTEALEKISVKTLQSNVQYLEAMAPVVNAVGHFAFGQSEPKLLQDITNKLTSSASSISSSLLETSLSSEEKKTAELAVLRTLAQLYADTHKGEVKKLMALGEEKRMSANITIDTVWNVFEIKVAMINALAENLVPGINTNSSSEAPEASAPTAPPPAQEASATLPSTDEPQIPPPASPPTEEAAKQPPSGNPMAMFAKKKPESEEASTEATPSATSPPAETPASPEAPPTETPPAPPPAEGPKEEEKPVDNPNPMSFFKAPPKKEEGDE